MRQVPCYACEHAVYEFQARRVKTFEHLVEGGIVDIELYVCYSCRYPDDKER